MIKRSVMILISAVLCLLCAVFVLGCQKEEAPDTGNTPPTENQTPTPDQHTHAFTEWSVVTPAGCNTDGEEARTCTCGEREVRPIAATGAHITTKELKCAVCNEPVAYYREGDRIYFGEYPQTLKADDVEITNETDDRGYYFGNDGAYYAKVAAVPYKTDYVFSTDETVQTGAEYYFKVEPLVWRIVAEKDGKATMVCTSVIANRAYDADSNNYANSDLRAWLNAAFFSAAFDADEQAVIITTTVDNSVSTTGHYVEEHACENTEDKVFLLSFTEATSATYGFVDNDARTMPATDYAIATGVMLNSDGTGGFWWLRSPAGKHANYACLISGGGGKNYTNNVSYTHYGILPALQIDLY